MTFRTISSTRNIPFSGYFSFVWVKWSKCTFLSGFFKIKHKLSMRITVKYYSKVTGDAKFRQKLFANGKYFNFSHLISRDEAWCIAIFFLPTVVGMEFWVCSFGIETGSDCCEADLLKPPMSTSISSSSSSPSSSTFTSSPSRPQSTDEVWSPLWGQKKILQNMQIIVSYA